MPTNALDEYRGFSYEIAEILAPTWESRHAEIEWTSAPARQWMLEALDPQPGDTVLELAAGTGETGFEAARLVGEKGRVIVSDFSPGMLDGARRRGAELGVANVDYRVLDAEKLDLERDSVDGVLCRFGYMLMADPAAALAETRRVLRQGGRLALTVWAAPERNPFFALVGRALVERGHISPPEPPPAPGIFAMASPQRTTALLRDAGFGDLRTEELPVQFVVPDAHEYLTFVADAAGPLAMAVRGLSEAEREGLEKDLQESLTPFAAEGGYQLPGAVLCAVAA